MKQYVGSKFTHPDDGGNYIIVNSQQEGDDYILIVVRQDRVVENPRKTMKFSQFKKQVKNIWV